MNFKNYLNEIVLTVWTVFVCTVFVLWFGANPSLKVCAVTGAVGFAGNIFVAWLLSFRVRNLIERDKLGWILLASTLLISLQVYITANRYGIDIFYECVIAMLMCWLICLILIERCTKFNIELEDLRKRDTKEYIRRMVKAKRLLSEEYEETMLHLPDANRLVAKYINYSRFWRATEDKFIRDRRFANLWKKYFKMYSLLDDQEMELFEREDAMEVVNAYSAGSQLCERGELKLFSMPNAIEWLKMYIEHGAFGSVKAEMKLFENPEYKELAEYYKSRYSLYDDTYRMLKEAC